MRTHLCFHGIGVPRREREPGEAHYWVAEDLLLRVLDLLPGRDDVDLSFDDGNRSDVDIALPALAERGLTATFFALAGRLQDPDSLDPEALVRLRAAGMRIGTHGWAHIPWRGLEPGEAQRELIDARAALERAGGTTIRHAALPLGRYDRALLQRLRATGYERVFTSDRMPAVERAWLSPRYSVTATDSVESVRGILAHRAGPGDAVRLGKAVLKRLR
ncbi:polysaccharide deacetylase family protein [Microbacterium capsulatum]|uniref:Polysaccharide deacetylase family protein n=1 Tax=Microbacterium capsulatum TaxID=3041921 RepID=A0ABU0XI84_9MICO|nr:polysaccharide deacetylase family protein [Microbacterium sp. ASV81]MDQ4214278.1 polysaccharide deacetylase family protein [Microbacterium sp. ASV81]